MLPCSVLFLLSTFFFNKDTKEPDPTKNNSLLETGLYQYHNVLLYTEHEHKDSLPKLTRKRITIVSIKPRLLSFRYSGQFQSGA